MADEARDYVFGYGSLAPDLRHGADHGQGARMAHLQGHRRTWNVAMDNTRDIAGYKFYRRPDGDRPPVFVSFLNVVPASRCSVNGVLAAVTAEELSILDSRERNYERIDVTPMVRDAPGGRVWAYIGRREAESRYQDGVAGGSAVVSREYYERVVRAFGRLGNRALVEFAASTDAPACPIVELERVDLDGQP